MAIQHRDITDPNIHEPKGVATANQGTAYMADGLGSGIWRKLVATDLSGVASSTEDHRILLGPSGAFKTAADFSIGSMLINNNQNAFGVTSAADSTLNTDSDYVLLTGNGAPWQADDLNLMRGVTFNTDRMTITVAGIYKLEFWAVIKGFPSNSAAIGVKYRLNGNTLGPAKAVIKSNSTGDYGNISAFGITQLSPNDYLQIMVASTTTGNLLFENFRFTAQLLKAT